jgi:monoamine oxidase
MIADHTDVLVIGAGAAGMMAARDLSQAGLTVRLLEARDRPGGRMYTLSDPALPVPIELGAEFVHGKSPELFAIARAANLPLYEVMGESWWSENGALRTADDRWETAGEIFARMAQHNGPDQTFAQFIAPFMDDERTRDAAQFVTSYVQGFDAAWPDRIGVRGLLHEQQAEDAIEGDRSFRFVGGYAGMVRWLHASLDPARVAVHLSTVVTHIQWQRGHAVVTAQPRIGQPRRFQATCALITLPLGVLQAAPDMPGSVRFDPPLPDKEAAIQRLEMGQAIRVVMHFRERWWADPALLHAQTDGSQDQLSFMLSRDEWMPTWWTSYPLMTPILVGWAGGPVAAQYAGRDETFIIAHALDALARITGMKRARIEDMLAAAYTHEWTSDPFARGAYSYLPVNGREAQQQLAAPVDGTLFFAGEATETDGHHATVHGALASGQRAAREIIARLQERQEPPMHAGARP